MSFSQTQCLFGCTGDAKASMQHDNQGKEGRSLSAQVSMERQKLVTVQNRHVVMKGNAIIKGFQEH